MKTKLDSFTKAYLKIITESVSPYAAFAGLKDDSWKKSLTKFCEMAEEEDKLPYLGQRMYSDITTILNWICNVSVEKGCRFESILVSDEPFKDICQALLENSENVKDTLNEVENIKSIMNKEIQTKENLIEAINELTKDKLEKYKQNHSY